MLRRFGCVVGRCELQPVFHFWRVDKPLDAICCQNAEQESKLTQLAPELHLKADEKYWWAMCFVSYGQIPKRWQKWRIVNFL